MYIQERTYYNNPLVAWLAVACLLSTIGLCTHVFLDKRAQWIKKELRAIANSVNFNIGFLQGRTVQMLETLHEQQGQAFSARRKAFTSSIEGFQTVYGTTSKYGGVYPKSLWYMRMSRLSDLFTDRDVHRHAAARKLVGPAFNQRSVAQYEGVMHQHIDELLETIQQAGNESVEMGHLIHCFVADLMFDVNIGKRTECLATSKPVIWTAALSRVFYWATVKDQLAGSGILTVLQYLLHGFFDRSARGPKLDAARTIQEQLQHSTFRSGIMLQVLDNNAQNGCTPDNLFPHVRAVLLASVHSTTTALTGTLKFVLRDSDVQKKLKEELNSSFGPGDLPSLEILQKLPYLNAVIDESLRLFPPIPLLGPRVSPGVEVDGMHVDAGKEILTSLYTLHRSPLYFPEPNKFMPERWLDQNSSQQRRAFHPFSTGSRSCIGKHLALQALRLALARILLEFDGRCEGMIADWPSVNKCYAVWEVPECFVQWRRSSRADPRHPSS